jgi:hypothetical protein
MIAHGPGWESRRPLIVNPESLGFYVRFGWLAEAWRQIKGKQIRGALRKYLFKGSEEATTTGKRKSI